MLPQEWIKRKQESRIAYIEGEWTGELFGKGGEIILKGTKVIFFSMKNSRVFDYEGLKNQVKAFIWLDETYGKGEVNDNS